MKTKPALHQILCVDEKDYCLAKQLFAKNTCPQMRRRIYQIAVRMGDGNNERINNLAWAVQLVFHNRYDE